MTREVFIHTPENIVFTYRLAGLPARILAALVDTALLGLAVGLLVGVAQLIALAAGVTSGASQFAASAALGIALAIGFLFVFGYFALFEGLWNGQTPGKRLLGIRVVKDRGEAIRLLDAVLRNLLRIADLVPGLYLVAVVSVLMSERNKRLGDLAAGTMVVEVDVPEAPESRERPAARFNSLREDPRLAQRVQRTLSIDDAELLRDVLARVAQEPRLRAGVVADLAAHYRDRLDLGETWDFLSDEGLLRDMMDILDAEAEAGERSGDQP